MWRRSVYPVFSVVLVLGLFGSAAAEVSYEYYKAAITNTGGSSMPPYDTWIPKRTGTLGRFDIKYRRRGDDFAFCFTGYIAIQTQGECFLGFQPCLGTFCRPNRLCSYHS